MHGNAECCGGPIRTFGLLVDGMVGGLSQRLGAVSIGNLRKRRVIKPPLRILWLSESPFMMSGFARVTREVVCRLARTPGLEVACLGWGYDGWPHASDQFPVPIYPAPSASYGRESFERVVAEFQPDVVITLAEIWMLDWLPSHPCRPRFKWIAYVPLDSGPLYPPWVPLIQAMDAVVAMAEFGRGVIREGVPSKDIDMILHGVDTGIFRPLLERSSLKAHKRLAGKFVVGCVARNQPRKNIPALIKAFSLLVRSDPGYHLYLHMSPCDVGHDLMTLLRRYELQGSADICPPEFSTDRGVSDGQLNQVYNFCDVTALPSMGEGFGLPIIESFAAGIPVVATDYAASKELVAQRGELVRVAAMLTTGTNVMEYAIIDVDDLAARIRFLRSQPKLIQRYSTECRAFAETLSWDVLLPKWIEVIRRVSGRQLDIGSMDPLPQQ